MKKIIPIVIIVVLLAGVGLGVHYFIGWDVVIGKISGSGNGDNDATYKVQYEYNGLQSIEVKKGEIYTLPSVPEKTGYVFLGLYDAPSGGNQMVSSTGTSTSEFSGNANILLYAQWEPKTYTVNFINGKTSVMHYEVSYGDILTSLPDAPMKTGHIFTSWVTNVGGESVAVADAYSFYVNHNIVNESNYSLENSINIYASYTPMKYKVEFVLDDGSSIIKELEYGTDISTVMITTKDSAVVVKWSEKENDSKGEKVFSGKITEKFDDWHDIKKLYAQTLGYSLTVDYNSETFENQTFILLKGDIVQQPSLELATGIRLIGWYDGEDKVDFPFELNKSTTIKAKYEAQVTYIANETEEPSIIWIEIGSTVQQPSISVPADISLKGWYEGESKVAFPFVIKGNTILRAKYEAQIVFDTNNENEPNKIVWVEVGEIVQQPSINAPYGFRVIGWYEGETKVEFPFAGNRNMTLTAKYQELEKFQVCYITNEGKKTESLYVGSKIQELSIELPTGIRLKGWYEGETKVKFPITTERDITLTAKYEAKVTYITNGANEPDKTEWIEVGTAIPAYNLTFNKFYTFNGWEYQGAIVSSLPICPFAPVTLTANAVTEYTFIRTAADFRNIQNRLDGKYALMNDIDLGEFKPLGDYMCKYGTYNIVPQMRGFSGVLDGNNKKISYSTYIDYTNVDYDYGWGLFGLAFNATFRDIVVNAHISSTYKKDILSSSVAGGIVGWASACSFINCVSEGVVSQNYEGTAHYGCARSGGLVGLAKDCRLESCTNKATVHAGGFYASAGGLVGGNKDSTYFYCKNYGKVSSTHQSWVFGSDNHGDIYGKV